MWVSIVMISDIDIVYIIIVCVSILYMSRFMSVFSVYCSFLYCPFGGKLLFFIVRLEEHSFLYCPQVYGRLAILSLVTSIVSACSSNVIS